MAGGARSDGILSVHPWYLSCCFLDVYSIISFDGKALALGCDILKTSFQEAIGGFFIFALPSDPNRPGQRSFMIS